MKQNYEMTEADLATLLEACKPVPMIMLQCGQPPSPQENANMAWAALGKKMGFDSTTVTPTQRGDRFFSAEPVKATCDGFEIQPGVFSGCDQSAGDCPVCGE